MPARMASRSAPYQSVRRVRIDSGRRQRRPGAGRPGAGSSGLAAEDVAGPSQSVDESPLSRAVDLATEVADVDIDHVGPGVEAEAPDVLGERGARLDAARMAHEALEEC